MLSTALLPARPSRPPAAPLAYGALLWISAGCREPLETGPQYLPGGEAGERSPRIRRFVQALVSAWHSFWERMSVKHEGSPTRDRELHAAFQRERQKLETEL